MKHIFIFLSMLLCVRVDGFFGVGSDGVSFFVMEGDSVTLYTDIETIQQEEIRWYFKHTLITEITGDPNKTCTDVQCSERFRDMELDNQTGSLTITNITNRDSGDYKLLINSSSDSLLQVFRISVYEISAAELDEVKRKSVMEGESVTLDPGVIKNPYYLMKWIFNGVRIAEISGDLSFICTDAQCLYADERFRHRLKLNHMTGSLTITDTRTEDTGLYYLLMSTNRFSVIRSFIVNVTGFFSVDTERVSLKEGDSVTLNTGVQTNQQEEIRWYFHDIRIAQITRDLSFLCTDVQCKYSDARFKNRLKLDHQTGSLTITHTRYTDSGLYHLEIFSSNSSSQNIFSVSVHGVPAAERDKVKRSSVKEGESVTLDSGVINPNDLMTWYFNDICIATITGDQSKICEDGENRFRDRLKLDHQTGSLTITNIRTTDSGLFKLQINGSRIIKIFPITVTDSGVSPAVVAGMCAAAVLLFVAAFAAVIYYRKRQAGQNDTNAVL